MEEEISEQSAAQQSPAVEMTLKDGIARIVLCNPVRRNAITREMWAGLTEAAKSLQDDEDLRVVLIRGQGQKAFASGADISEFGEARRSSEQAEAYTQTVQAAVEAIELIPVPVVALVHGFCIGAGTAIALACDMRYLDDQARFAVPAARLGIGYSPKWIKRLVDVVGKGYASEILMTGSQLDADAALRCQFANAVRPAAELDEFVEDRLQRMSRNAPLSMRASKAAIRECMAFDRDRDWQLPFDLSDRCASSRDYEEALDAFANKRSPDFHGR
ncbi:enoyl-CoA hydratase-related protein [Notoacmeibacter ruber]|uniref:Enoyl-CoA hydratase n=1 Tax=Notoacmeibacter ruber TaxID=2670375 RepID=A0A3L7J9N5_9HYPH|nr:enoyl-CoA hydratase-related protein [Notoacmeibacter ruber]RLQ87210.1 enoyl-CoA hydratase [Notoacmeibacter ruber]